MSLSIQTLSVREGHEDTLSFGTFRSLSISLSVVLQVQAFEGTGGSIISHFVQENVGNSAVGD